VLEGEKEKKSSISFRSRDEKEKKVILPLAFERPEGGGTNACSPAGQEGRKKGGGE